MTRCPAGPTLEHIDNNFDQRLLGANAGGCYRKSEGCPGFLVFLLLSVLKMERSLLFEGEQCSGQHY